MKSGKKSLRTAILVAIVSIITIIGLSDISFLIPKNNQTTEKESDINEKKMEDIVLKSKDGKDISAIYFKAKEPKGWIIYLHMMPSTKESYVPIATQLQEKGFSGIAIDFRGHGKSTGGPDGYLKFNDLDHQSSILDVESAFEFLKENGAVKEKISVIGASIGANLGLKLFAENKELQKIVLLSPGINYRGVTAKDLAVKIEKGRSVLILSSKDDGYNEQESEEIFSLIPIGVKKEKEIYEKAGHGTTIFTKEPESINKIINFIEQ